MMPTTIQTMAWAYKQICAGEDPWTALGNFTNAWYGYAKGMRAALVSEPLAEPEQVTEHTLRWEAVCAASVEFLCERYGIPCPAWVHNPRHILATPWWHTSHTQSTSMYDWYATRELLRCAVGCGPTMDRGCHSAHRGTRRRPRKKPPNEVCVLSPVLVLLMAHSDRKSVV